MKDKEYKCILLKGELSDLGKHILLPFGVTLCGCFTADYDKNNFKNVPMDIINEYEIKEWDISCERCLDMFDTIKNSKI